MKRKSIYLGRVAGIPIRMHISLPIVIGFLALYSGFHPLAIGILAVGVFGSVALHELGHSLVARAKGSYIHEIVLYPFGGAAKISNLSKRPTDEILIALAGPAVSLALAVVFRQWEWSYFLGYLNTMLFLFNMLPVFPMDGGRVLRAALSIKYNRLPATRKAVAVGKYFCGLFVLIGFFGLPVQLFGIIGPFRANLMLAFIGGYIYVAGQQEYRMVQLEHQAEPFSVQREAPMDVEVSPPPYAVHGKHAATLRERLRRLFRL